MFVSLHSRSVAAAGAAAVAKGHGAPEVDQADVTASSVKLVRAHGNDEGFRNVSVEAFFGAHGLSGFPGSARPCARGNVEFSTSLIGPRRRQRAFR